MSTTFICLLTVAFIAAFSLTVIILSDADNKEDRQYDNDHDFWNDPNNFRPH
jgi:hypothetical protein